MLNPETERRKEAFDWWARDHATEYGRLNPLVAEAYRRLAWRKALITGNPDLTQADRQRAEIELVSALRVDRHGELNPETAHAQHTQIRAELGLGSVPITVFPKPLGA